MPALRRWKPNAPLLRFAKSSSCWHLLSTTARAGAASPSRGVGVASSEGLAVGLDKRDGRLALLGADGEVEAVDDAVDVGGRIGQKVVVADCQQRGPRDV